MHTQGREGLVERFALLSRRRRIRQVQTLHQLRTHIRQVKTCIPGEDTYPEAIIGFHQREHFACSARSLNNDYIILNFKILGGGGGI